MKMLYLMMVIFTGIKMAFHQKLGKVCDALATVTSVYSVMGSWKLGKTRKLWETSKILIPDLVLSD